MRRSRSIIVNRAYESVGHGTIYPNIEKFKSRIRAINIVGPIVMTAYSEVVGAKSVACVVRITESSYVEVDLDVLVDGCWVDISICARYSGS
jgi:hypothetical protein